MERGVSPMALARWRADQPRGSTLDGNDIGGDALRFQAGYLTMVDESWDGGETLYPLDYPHLAICRGLNHGLLAEGTRCVRAAVDHGQGLFRRLGERDFAGFAAPLQAGLAGGPYAWHDQGELARDEAWSASRVSRAFRTIGGALGFGGAERNWLGMRAESA